MDDVFNNALEDPKPAHQPAEEQPEAETVEQPEQAAPEAGAESGTTPQEQAKHVPLAALEAERKGRQDWKERAIRYEEELKALKANQQAAAQQAAPQQPMDPVARVEQQMVNERFNTSEMLMRDKHADLDETVDVFSAAAKQNPALLAQLQMARHPWEFAYREGKRLQAMAELGDDPSAYEAKIRAKIMAELQSQPTQAAASAPPIPQSLASARSSAARSAPSFSGPQPLKNLFEN